jgi:hypothetical protein
MFSPNGSVFIIHIKTSSGSSGQGRSGISGKGYGLKGFIPYPPGDFLHNEGKQTTDIDIHYGSGHKHRSISAQS